MSEAKPFAWEPKHTEHALAQIEADDKRTAIAEHISQTLQQVADDVTRWTGTERARYAGLLAEYAPDVTIPPPADCDFDERMREFETEVESLVHDLRRELSGDDD